eukprot:1512778-Pleurochrysis_carterae.AAC.2
MLPATTSASQRTHSVQRLNSALCKNHSSTLTYGPHVGTAKTTRRVGNRACIRLAIGSSSGSAWCGAASRNIANSSRWR